MSLYWAGHPMTKYFEGGCGDFAVAVHRLTNGTIKALVEWDDQLNADVLIHAFVQLEDGTVIDASGYESCVQTMLDEFPNSGHARLVVFTEAEIFQIANGTSDYQLSNEVLSDAKMILQLNGHGA